MRTLCVGLFIGVILAALLTPALLNAQKKPDAKPPTVTITTSNNVHLIEWSGRSVVFECGVEYLDSSTCIQKTKRIRFDGAWENVELCWRERCMLLDTVFPKNPSTADVSQ